MAGCAGSDALVVSSDRPQQPVAAEMKKEEPAKEPQAAVEPAPKMEIRRAEEARSQDNPETQNSTTAEEDCPDLTE